MPPRELDEQDFPASPEYSESPDTQVPPWSDDAEQAVLSAMMADPRAVAAARAIVRAESFYSTKHRRLFGAMVRLSDAQMVIDPITITEQLSRTGELEAAGG